VVRKPRGCPYTLGAEADKDTEVVREKVQDGLTGETREMQYTQCKIVGNGSFGVVFQTKLAPNGEDAAIKRVLQDKRFKVDRVAIFLQRNSADGRQNRELQIMRIVRHPNIVELKAFYYSNGERVGYLYLLTSRMIQLLTRNVCLLERRSLLEPGVGIRSGDRISRIALLQQVEDDHAYPGDQNLHISAVPLTRIHPFARYLSQGYQATEPATRSEYWGVEAL